MRPNTRDYLVVSEELEELGFACKRNREWTKEEALATADVLGKFHGVGMKLIKEDPKVFWFKRDLYTLKPTENIRSQDFEKFAKEILCELKKADHSGTDAKGYIKKFEYLVLDKLSTKLHSNLLGKLKLRTIGQGNVLKSEIALKREDSGGANWIPTLDVIKKFLSGNIF
ncbi:hypothetical protein TKK_0002404 [Trichogramma kaykai]